MAAFSSVWAVSLTQPKPSLESSKPAGLSLVLETVRASDMVFDRPNHQKANWSSVGATPAQTREAGYHPTRAAGGRTASRVEELTDLFRNGRSQKYQNIEATAHMNATSAKNVIFEGIPH